MATNPLQTEVNPLIAATVNIRVSSDPYKYSKLLWLLRLVCLQQKTKAFTERAEELLEEMYEVQLYEELLYKKQPYDFTDIMGKDGHYETVYVAELRKEIANKVSGFDPLIAELTEQHDIMEMLKRGSVE